MIVSKSGKIMQGDNYLYYPGLTELLQLPCPELLHCDSLYRLDSPAQVQQPTMSEVTFQPLDLVLTLTPEPTRRLTLQPCSRWQLLPNPLGWQFMSRVCSGSAANLDWSYMSNFGSKANPPSWTSFGGWCHRPVADDSSSKAPQGDICTSRACVGSAAKLSEICSSRHLSLWSWPWTLSCWPQSTSFISEEVAFRHSNLQYNLL